MAPCLVITVHGLTSFVLSSDWRDTSWQNIASVHNGVPKTVQSQRSTLFGLNLIDIEGKSTATLLIDEVPPSVSLAVGRADIDSLQIIHPFYVFQIASIILWSLDDYYYYAFCIALISAISIVTTLIETKQVCSHVGLPLRRLTYSALDYCPHARNVEVYM